MGGEMTDLENKPITSTGELTSIRRQLLEIIKQGQRASIAELADQVDLSYEAVRQQMAHLRSAGWVAHNREESDERGVGRPTSYYRLTLAGEHLFPKRYHDLSTELIDVIAERHGLEGMRRTMEDLVARRVERWQPALEGLEDRQKLQVLREIYQPDDPYTSVEAGEDGSLRLVERNCPYLNVASRRPALCSLTVETLSRLLGRRVVREERFQNGDGRCVFRVLEKTDEQPRQFKFESERSAC